MQRAAAQSNWALSEILILAPITSMITPPPPAGIRILVHGIPERALSVGHFRLAYTNRRLFSLN
jgi:hypothetical protein